MAQVKEKPIQRLLPLSLSFPGGRWGGDRLSIKNGGAQEAGDGSSNVVGIVQVGGDPAGQFSGAGGDGRRKLQVAAGDPLGIVGASRA